MTPSLATGVALDLVLRTTLVLASGALGRHLVRRQSASRRHLVGVATLLAAFVTLATPWLPGYRSLTPVGRWSASTLTEASAAAVSADAFTREAVGKERSAHPLPVSGAPVTAATLDPAAGVAVVWVVVALALLLRLGAGLVGALRLVHRAAGRRQDRRLGAALGASARELGLPRAPGLVLASGAPPMAWGPPSACVVLPPEAGDWEEGRLRMTLLHELGHIRRRDSLSQALARALCAILWFNPLAWRLQRALAFDQEEACDDLVVCSGLPVTEYARHLLDLVAAGKHRAPMAWASLPGEDRDGLVNRIRRLLSADRRLEPVDLRLAAVTATATLAALLALGACGIEPAEPPAETPVLDRTTAPGLVEPMADEMAEAEIPGAMVVLVKDGEVLLEKGFGWADQETRRAVDPETTVFRLGSITKPLTALALLRVLEEKEIPLDAPVAPYVPDLEVPSASGQPVTFRHLLTHTGGFDQLGYGRLAAGPGEVLPLEKFLAANLVADRPPGELCVYDTYGMTLAGHLIKTLTGSSYTDYMVREVFRPLGMATSGFGGPELDDLPYAVGYAGHGEEMEARPWEYHHTTPTSSANATGGDMARLMIALLDDEPHPGPPGPGTRQAALRQQFSNHPRLDGYGYGFLTGVANGHPFAKHGGSMDGFSALLFLVPEERLGLFVAYNREDGRLADAIARALMERFFPAPEPEPELDPPLPGEVDLEQLAGPWINALRCHTCDGRTDFYWKAEPFELSVTDDGALVVGGGPARRIGPLLFQRDDGLLIAFRADDEGRPTHMLIRQSVYERADSPVPQPEGR